MRALRPHRHYPSSEIVVKRYFYLYRIKKYEVIITHYFYTKNVKRGQGRMKFYASMSGLGEDRC